MAALLPSLNPCGLAAMNTLAGLRRPVELALDSGDLFLLRFLSDPKNAEASHLHSLKNSEANDLQVHLRWKNETLGLHLRQLDLQIWQKRLPHADFGKLPAWVNHALAAEQLDPLLSCMETLLGGTLEQDSPDADRKTRTHSAGARLWLHCENLKQKRVLLVGLNASSSFLETLLERLEQWPLQQAAEAWELPAQIRFGYGFVELKMSDLKALRPGACILLDPLGFNHKKYIILFFNGSCWLAERQFQSLSLLGTMRTENTSKEFETSESSETLSTASEAEPMAKPTQGQAAETSRRSDARANADGLDDAHADGLDAEVATDSEAAELSANLSAGHDANANSADINSADANSDNANSADALEPMDASGNLDGDGAEVSDSDELSAEFSDSNEAGAEKLNEASAEKFVQNPEEVQVPVELHLGSVQLPFKELGALQAGYVFELKEPVDTLVNLCVHGRRIGCGEVVELGDRLGVRVTQIFGNG